MARERSQVGHVYASMLRGVIGVAEAHGVETRGLLREAGIEPKLISLQDARVTVAQFYQLFELLASRIKTRDFGLLAGRIAHLENIHFLLYMASTARNLRNWLNMMPAFSKLAGDFGAIRIHRDSDAFCLQWQPFRAPDPQRCSITDLVMATTVAQMGMFCLLPLEPLRVDLTYKKPAETARLQQIFGLRLYFGQPRSAVWYSDEVLEYRMAPVAARFYAGVAEEFSRRFSDRGSLQDAFFLGLYSAIRGRLPSGNCNIEQVASDLNLSRRTLQRRLSERSTNFLQVLQSIKYELAKHYLIDESLSVIEITFLLGYSDPSTFSAAFKSWHGSTPTDFRENN